MNKYYSETSFDNLIKSIECNICVVLLKCFVESLSMRHYLHNEQTSCLFANMFYNQKRSIISLNVLMIEASKLDTYVKGHKWIDTIERFQ